MHWVEDSVDALRRAAGVWDFPRWEGTLRLVEYLAATVRLHFVPDYGLAWCRHWANGSTSIWVPEGREELLAHELGHACLTNDLAGTVQFSNPGLARIQVLHEEAVAERFARAWLLPRALCKCHLLTVFEESGCSVELLRRRMEDLGQG